MSDTSSDNLGKAQWRAIRRAPRYDVSSDGQVRNVSTGKLRKLHLNTHGYPTLIWRRSGSRKSVATAVHILVAEAFLPKVDGKTHVNHKNGVKTDNRVENLEWCSVSENTTHAVRVLNRDIGQHRKLSWDDVLAIRIRNAAGESRAALAASYNCGKTTVEAIVTGRSWNMHWVGHRGF